jgi:hypothetical protein
MGLLLGLADRRGGRAVAAAQVLHQLVVELGEHRGLLGAHAALGEWVHTPVGREPKLAGAVRVEMCDCGLRCWFWHDDSG